MISWKKYVVVVLLGFLALFVQGSLLKLLAPQTMIVPNLGLVAVVFLAFYDLSVSGVVLSFILGLQIDASSGLLMGPWAAAYVAVFGLVSSISQRVFVESPFAIAVAAFFSCLLGSFVYLACVFQFRPAAFDMFSLSFVMLLEALFTAVLAPLIFVGFRRILIPRSAAAGGRGNWAGRER